jgi:hydroxymethylglutaryl-CoA lyase
MASFPTDRLACHFHDTFDTAIPNILIALENGYSTFDSSVGGLGGCPYAKKSTGNVCTETVVYTMQELGIETGINLPLLKSVGDNIC